MVLCPQYLCNARTNLNNIYHQVRKVSWLTTMKKVAIFVIFGATDAMVLVIIELEGCACAQYEAIGKQNRSIYPCDTWILSERQKCNEYII